MGFSVHKSITSDNDDFMKWVGTCCDLLFLFCVLNKWSEQFVVKMIPNRMYLLEVNAAVLSVK